ncbi:hypothetical protein [Microbacterium sp. NPDC056234]|uniref:hypothetical protein n=1 Tax=Microbacterium sp. NPDC056234 TaxID=3345757 RepID=UPI0035DDB7F0
MSSIAIAYREAARMRRVSSLVLSILTIVMSIGILVIFVTRPEVFLSTGTSALTPTETAIIDAREHLLLLPIIALALLLRMPRRTPPDHSSLTVPLVFGIVAAGLCVACYVYPQAVVLIAGAFFLTGVLLSGAG